MAGYCWAYGDGRTTCADPEQPATTALQVRRGETVGLRIQASRRPNELHIRPFQGGRDGYPAQRVEAAVDTPLEIALEPGEWEMDSCADWRGHAETICWVFRLQVAGSEVDGAVAGG